MPQGHQREPRSFRAASYADGRVRPAKKRAGGRRQALLKEARSAASRSAFMGDGRDTAYAPHTSPSDEARFVTAPRSSSTAA